MLQNGIERKHLGSVVASCNGEVGSGLSIPMFLRVYPLNQHLPQ